MQELMNFATVLIVAVGIAGCIGVYLDFGAFIYVHRINGVAARKPEDNERLWAKSGVPEGGDGSPNYLFRFASVACFAACVVVVLFALWLMIPMFH